MKNILSALFVLIFTVQAAYAQTFALKGKLVDKASGEGLAGASVQVTSPETTTGGLTEVNGTFKVENLKPGTYTVTASYIGYLSATETVVISGKDAFVTFRLGEDNATLNEVEIVADVAVERETPVAFSAIKESTIRESLAGRDLPLLLNETPGVYATNQGGGPGESRISIRGFSQENIAVMVNGVPVNDMENGRVFWSNWDLGDVTKSTQVQRGLSASKLATPSVGGTMNILTKGFENKRSMVVRQEIGSNNYSKTSLMYSSGQLNGDWAFTVYGSRRTGDGWVEGTWDDSWSYFANISKKFGNHTLSLTGLGSPQKHGQRAFAKNIATYSAEKAKELGATNYIDNDGKIVGDYGFDYNAHWGDLDRYTISEGDTIHHREKLNERQNFYHKPQFNLNHFWTISDKLFMSNVVYASIGNGGGVSPLSTIATKDGRPNFQGIYDANYKNRETAKAANILRANVNNHRWYGFISGMDYKATERTTLSAGIDGRTYKGEHYSEIYDLLGANYASNISGHANQDPNTKLTKGDKISFNNDGYVRYIGGFLMAEYKTPVLSAFVSGTLSNTAYKRKDYFLPKFYNINGTETPVGFYTTPGTILNQVNNIYYTQSDYVISGKDTIQLNQDAPVTVGIGNNKKDIQQVSGTGKLKESDWVKFTGYTIKGGLNYNLNEFNNIFFNLGYINKPQFFNFVFDTRTGEQFANNQNEGVMSFEVGYGISRNNFKANLNGYHTTWYDRSLSSSVQDEATGGMLYYNITGMDARHIGVELELAQEISRKVSLNAAISLGDWRWNSTGLARIISETGVLIDEVNFNAKGVHVGGSAQNQFMVGVRYEPIKGFYIRPTYLMFTKNYADFSPTALPTDKTPQDAFRLPTSRNIDIHSGYSFKFYKDLKLTLNGSVLNVLNEFYITDAPTRSGIDQFDPDKIEVFFNRGRTFVIGASVAL
ncbi:carboxypeptidase-like regulatory domain-containing protein [Adhaeribacter terreus]|uniref:Carboxypeptidase-like regulatory domain-containing protein n=1 Tax=Adhaeribacter terreus TaxID=529703 RepID=A0ABW0EG16_9BACT